MVDGAATRQDPAQKPCGLRAIMFPIKQAGISGRTERAINPA